MTDTAKTNKDEPKKAKTNKDGFEPGQTLTHADLLALRGKGKPAPKGDGGEK